MQSNTNLDRASLGELVVSIFESGNPEVYVRDTDRGEKAVVFASAHEMNDFINAAIKAYGKSIGFAVWYPETRGYVEKKTVSPDPNMGGKRSVRHAIRGWGLLALQLDFESLPLINCCISCSTRKKRRSGSSLIAI